MAVLIDTVLCGVVKMMVICSHPVKSRIDGVYAGNGSLNIVYGTEQDDMRLCTVPAQHCDGIADRLVAKIYIHPSQTSILNSHIEEIGW